MRLVVIADVHANWPALQVVLADAAQLKADQRVCLGDLVGYNAQPVECITAVREFCDVVIAGNHDWDIASVQEPLIGTTSHARLVQAWTREQLGDEHVAYLAQLPNKHIEASVYIAVHGCYLNDVHVNGYVTQTMLRANLEALAARDDWPSVGFSGHTHCPQLAYLRNGEVHTVKPLDPPVHWPADAQAVLINPGSVGQPRDEDPRCSYALVDFEQRSVEFRRLDYDIDATAAAAEGTGLPEVLVRRLYQGR